MTDLVQAERVLEIALRPAYLVFDFRRDFHGGGGGAAAVARARRGSQTGLEALGAAGRRPRGLSGAGTAGVPRTGRACDAANLPPTEDEPALSERKTDENESDERAPPCTLAHLQLLSPTLRYAFEDATDDTIDDVNSLRLQFRKYRNGEAISFQEFVPSLPTARGAGNTAKLNVNTIL